jgi:hypothetical protein
VDQARLALPDQRQGPLAGWRSSGRPEAQRQLDRPQARRRSMKAPGSMSRRVSRARTSGPRSWRSGS